MLPIEFYSSRHNLFVALYGAPGWCSRRRKLWFRLRNAAKQAKEGLFSCQQNIYSELLKRESQPAGLTRKTGKLNCEEYIVLPIEISRKLYNFVVALYVCQEGKPSGRSVGSTAGMPIKRAWSPFYRPDNKYTHRFLTKGQARRACPLFWKIIFRWVYARASLPQGSSKTRPLKG